MTYSTQSRHVFDTDALANLDEAGIGFPVTYPDDAVVITDGDDSDHVLLILSGHVAISSGGQIIAVAGPGETVGEMAALGTPPRSAAVGTIGEVTALLIAAPVWRDWLTTYPGAAMTQLAILQDRLATATRRLATASLPAAVRVARVLIDLADLGVGTTATDDTGTVTITWPQTYLAAMAGVSRESVITAIRDLKASGVVATGRGSTTILDVAALRRLAAAEAAS